MVDVAFHVGVLPLRRWRIPAADVEEVRGGRPPGVEGPAPFRYVAIETDQRAVRLSGLRPETAEWLAAFIERGIVWGPDRP